MSTRFGCHAVAVAGVIAMVFLSTAGYAQDLKKTPKLGRWMDRLPQLTKGSAMISSGEIYILLPEIHAVLKFSSGDPHQYLVNIGFEGVEVLEIKGRYVVFKSSQSELNRPTPVLASRGGKTIFPVVINERTGQFGVVTGAITVTLKDGRNAREIRADHGVRLKGVFSQIGIAIYATEPGQDLTVKLQGLAEDPRVEDAQVEILENFRVPH